MSIFGSIGNAIKGGVHAVGKLAEKAAPIVGTIPGVGTIAAGAIGGLGGLAAGDGLKGALKYGAEGALGDIGANLIGKIPGVSGLVSKIPGVGKFIDLGTGGALPKTPGDIMSALPGGSYDGALPNNSSGASSKIPGIGGMGLNDLGNANVGNSNTGSGIMDLVAKYAPLALGAAGAFQNAQQSSQARDLTNQEVADAKAARARQQGLQDQVLANLKNPIAAPNYTNIFSQTQNPFYQPHAGG